MTTWYDYDVDGFLTKKEVDVEGDLVVDGSTTYEYGVNKSTLGRLATRVSLPVMLAEGAWSGYRIGEATDPRGQLNKPPKILSLRLDHKLGAGHPAWRPLVRNNVGCN